MHIFTDDYYRNTGKNFSFFSGIFSLFTSHNIRYIFYLRILQNRRFAIIHPFIQICRALLTRKSGIEIRSTTKIGRGFRLVHPYNITINPRVELGSNVNLYKGVTIGFALGKRKGVPTIGNRVQIGANATVVGNVKIGDDVLIAPNAFVNIDVPDHSVVIGNPAVIYSKADATKGYVDHLVT